MFSASDVKNLREKTGAGMMDCKKALQESNGNMDKAIDWLREKGISKAAKKESRIAAEGLTKIVANDEAAVIVEVNSETDFVAKNKEFTNFVDMLANTILTNDKNTPEEVLELKNNNITINESLIALIAKIGEKISFRRFQKLIKTNKQVFGIYSHMGGRIGVIAVLDGNNEAVAKDVAMHIAAMNPLCLNRDSVAKDVLEHEKTVIKEQVMNEGKPEDIALKMVNGRINKFYKENCLLEQEFIKDPSISVEQYAKNNNCSVVSYIRFEVGEGIEKRQENFAEEVMSQIKG